MEEELKMEYLEMIDRGGPHDHTKPSGLYLIKGHSTDILMDLLELQSQELVTNFNTHTTLGNEFIKPNFNNVELTDLGKKYLENNRDK